jgi:outer membrane lipoprotein SlyB
MSRSFFCFFAIALMAATPNVVQAQANTQRGATLGGLTGAIAGGLIGDHNDEAGAGAAIGGVVGAVAGGLLGNAKDKENAYRQQQQRYYHQQQAQLQYEQQHVQTQNAVSINDVISMSRSGLGDSVIMNQINQRGVQHTLQVSDIIALHQQGVSENVIASMQRAPTGIQRITQVQQPSVQVQRIVTPAPVIVEEHYVVPHYAPPRYYRAPVHHHHHGVHFGF